MKKVLKHTPCSDHVEVEYGSDGAIKGTTKFEGLDPGVKGEHEKEDGDCFIVIGACNRTRYVSRDNTNESSSEKAST